MSIDYEFQPISSIKFDQLKSDLSKGKIKGLNIGFPKKGDYIPKGVGSPYYITYDHNNLFVYKLNKKGDVVFTAYGLSSKNDPGDILDKLSDFYKCDYIDEYSDEFIPYKYGKGVDIR